MVPSQCRQGALSDRGYLVADRDGWNFDPPLPGATPLTGSQLFHSSGETVLLDAQSGDGLRDRWAGAGDGRTTRADAFVYGDHKRFEDTYFDQYKGYYFTGDGYRRDEDGYYWITGRVDDVLMYLDTVWARQVESALVARFVAEAAVVEFMMSRGGVMPMSPSTEQEYTEEFARIETTISSVIGPIATPDVIHWAPAMPKTRSSKIMWILRKIATNETEQIGDTSTLADPAVVDNLIANRWIRFSLGTRQGSIFSSWNILNTWKFI